jgi:hypothetical protein
MDAEERFPGLWAPDRLAWWVAVVFLVGSALFVAGAVASLMPNLFGGREVSSVVAEACYAVGALLYTGSVYGQLIEHLNADDRLTGGRPARWRWCGVEPARLGWWVPVSYLVGALVFDYEAVAALLHSLGVVEGEVGLWWTSLVGALGFALGGVLHLVQEWHGQVLGTVRDVSWWIAAMFLLGGVGFVIGALPGFGPAGLPGTGAELPSARIEPGPTIVEVGFLIGALAFLVGSVLMLPELVRDVRRAQS